jgi:acetyltransferase-like isoleucine patch superfamily enzyme
MRFLVHFIMFFIPFKRQRKQMRIRIQNFVYGAQIRKKAKSIGGGLRVRNPSSVTSKTIIGDCVSLGGVEVYGGGKCTIGNYSHLGAEVLILTQNHNYEGATLPYESTFSFKEVVIGEAVWIGSRVTILPGTRIGSGAIVQAGAVVHGEVPSCAIIGGNPAKIFAWRNKDHFNELFRKGLFYRKEERVKK